MSPRTHPTLLATRDAIAQLLDEIGETLGWAVRLALCSAFNYLADTLATLAPPPPPPQEPSEPSRCPDVAVRIETLRDDLLGLLEHPPEEFAEEVDPYAVGHAAGELGAALRELGTGRPA